MGLDKEKEIFALDDKDSGFGAMTIRRIGTFAGGFEEAIIIEGMELKIGNLTTRAPGHCF